MQTLEEFNTNVKRYVEVEGPQCSYNVGGVGHICINNRQGENTFTPSFESQEARHLDTLLSNEDPNKIALDIYLPNKQKNFNRFCK